jgi:hypothetical protein
LTRVIASISRLVISRFLLFGLNSAINDFKTYVFQNFL